MIPKRNDMIKPDLQIQITEGLYDFARLVKEAGARLYLVGGTVRNAILGLPVSDCDVCSSLAPEKVLKLCDSNGIRYVPKGIEFGTVELHIAEPLGKISIIEHTTFRSDSYGAGGTHRPEQVGFSDSLETDAKRRDFTVNALYYDILESTVYDTLNGLEDLKSKQLKATSSDPNLILRDDGLRVMRLARLAAELGFGVEPNTFEAARDNAALLADISAERIRDELNKLIMSDSKYGLPASTVYNGLTLLSQTGAFKYMLPELERCRGIMQRAEHHAYPVLEHCMHACECAPKILDLRLAALMHDVGKPVAIAQSGNMYAHDLLGESISREIMTRLRYPNNITEAVSRLIRWHMYDLTNEAKESTVRAKFAVLGKPFSIKLIALREADVLGSGIIKGKVDSAEKWKRVIKQMEKEGAPFSEAELHCTGDDIMRWLNLPPSPKIGEIKRKLLEHCAKKPKDNTRERLMAIAKNMVRRDGS